MGVGEFWEILCDFTRGLRGGRGIGSKLVKIVPYIINKCTLNIYKAIFNAIRNLCYNIVNARAPLRTS